MLPCSVLQSKDAYNKCNHQSLALYNSETNDIVVYAQIWAAILLFTLYSYLHIAMLRRN
jgi:hypothetical protein